MSKVLVTGGCGFIGTNLISYLMDHSNWFVNVLDDCSQGKVSYLHSIPNYNGKRIKVVEGDVREEESMEEAISGCEYVVHLAGKTGVIPSINTPFHHADVNIIGTINVLEAALRHNIKRVCFASSTGVSGDQRPISPFGASKLAGEGYCSAYSGSHGISTAALRFPNVYGPNSRHKDTLIPQFIKTIMEGGTPVIYGSGEQTRDFVHVRDMSSAIHASLIRELPSTFEVFQLGTGKETSVNELYDLLKKRFTAEGMDVPEPTYAPRRAGEILDDHCDISRSREVLGYEPKYDLEKGLENTIEWFMTDKGYPPRSVNETASYPHNGLDRPSGTQ